MTRQTLKPNKKPHPNPPTKLKQPTPQKTHTKQTTKQHTHTTPIKTPPHPQSKYPPKKTPINNQLLFANHPAFFFYLNQLPIINQPEHKALR